LDKGYVKPVDFSTVVEELEVIQAPLSYSWGVVGHLMGVKNSDDLRKSHDLLQVLRIDIKFNLLIYHVVSDSLQSWKPIKK